MTDIMSVEIPVQIYEQLERIMPGGTDINIFITQMLEKALKSMVKRRSHKLESIEMYLYAELINGPVSVSHLSKELGNQGVSKKTIARAKKNLGIASFKEGWGGTGQWFWKLPE